MCRGSACAGQDRATETVELGAAGASAEPGAAGLGRADIEKASGGTIKSTLFPSEQLGKAMDHYDMARDGIADFAYVNPGYQPGRFPIIAAGELPFLMANAKGGSAALDAWYRKYAPTEMKDVHFCFAFVLDPRHVPLADQEDRAARGHPRHEDAPGGRNDGCVRHPAGWHERAGLGTGSARGRWNAAWPMPSPSPGIPLILFGIDKVVKYDMDMPFCHRRPSSG